MRLTQTLRSVLRSVHFLADEEELTEGALLELPVDLVLVLDDLGVLVLLGDNDDWHFECDDLGELLDFRYNLRIVPEHAGHLHAVQEKLGTGFSELVGDELQVLGQHPVFLNGWISLPLSANEGGSV